MATRRATSRRLVEGATYNAALPRNTKRLSRGRVLVGPQYEQPLAVIGGTPVPQGSPVLAARQRPVVGCIVQASNSRRMRISPTTSPTDPVIHSHVSASRPANLNSYTQRVNEYSIYVVNAVSECGKYVRLTSLATLPASFGLAWSHADARLKLSVGNMYYYDDSMVRHYGTPPLTQSLVQAHVAGSWATEELEYPHSGLLVRSSSIIRYIDPSQLPELLVGAMLAKAREQAAAVMFASLAKQEALRQPQHNPMRSSRSFVRPSGVLHRTRAAEAVRDHLQAARRYLQSGERTSAVRQLSEAHSRIIGLYQVLSPYNNAAGLRSAQRMLDKFCAANGIERLSQASGCGHFHEGESVQLVTDRYGSSAQYCPQCASTAVTTTTAEGETVQAHASVAVYEWSDGTKRLYREPSIVGGRHTGKGVVGFVQPLSGAMHGTYITLGMELEMQAVEPSQREIMAKALHTRLKSSNLLDAVRLRKYLHFEEDGSTGPGGFEMVTGYTDLATHAKLLHWLLVSDSGKPAWQGKLRSHDARGGSCGIHVHVQKPTSLIHASKIRYFINAAASERLVRDVARRYNDGFARINNSAADSTPQETAANMVKQVKYSRHDRLRREHTALAMQRFNQHSRYEALNFLNQNTLEFRIFRGTLMYVSVMACLEFTQAAWHFCRFCPATQLTPDNFVAWLNHPDNRADTRNLRVYLKRKGWACYVPNPRKDAPPTTESTEDGLPTVTPAEIEQATSLPTFDPTGPIPIPADQF